MIEVEVVSASASYAASTISLPNFQLNRGRNESIVLEVICVGVLSRRLVREFQAELENLSATRGLSPSIDQTEPSVVDPYSTSNFLINSDMFSRGSIGSASMRSFKEATVLRQCSTFIVHWLI